MLHLEVIAKNLAAIQNWLFYTLKCKFSQILVTQSD